ncbi:hypothetical protein Bpfe_031229 [Biomphalaria pfeifferi]|uniref:Uncharacterized protein n=1 Tax=Biomphalaria pfeifferi TaxID=112525 RepID=A0AAD8AN66_BIOPF|nr:hypothetical protein Bpfe_031229 [Biomphalaria pfeifferi]
MINRDKTGAFVIAALEVKFLDRRKDELLRKHLSRMFFISQERKSEARRRSDTVVVLTINYATWPSAGVASMTLRAASGKPKVLGSGGSMVAKLKLKGIDGRAPPGVEPAA